MSGALLAAGAGVGFGLFQGLNARPVAGFEDPFLTTIVQVAIATAALALVALATGDLTGIAHAPASALGYFSVAGLVHFLAGWSLLNLSQRRIGAARTSPLLTTVPLFGVVIAAITLGELPGAIALAGIAVMTLGAYVVAMRGGLETPRLTDALPALACSLCWALSPIFTRRGLEGFDSALAGLVVGLAVSTVVSVALYVALRGGAWPRVGAGGVSLKVVAGLLVGLATWTRWESIDRSPVGIVLALSLLSVPVVLFLAPILAGRHREHVTAGLWAGAGLVVAGALILVVA